MIKELENSFLNLFGFVLTHPYWGRGLHSTYCAWNMEYDT